MSNEKKNLIPHLFNSASGLNDFKNLYVEQFIKSLEHVKKLDLNFFYHLILEVHQNDGHIFFCGNGGSAANANHFSCGLSYIVDNFKKPIRSTSLSADSHLVTSLANDYGYDQIFKKQLEVHGRSNDVLVCFSVSGNSKNILEAARYAKSKGIKVFAFTGHDGGELMTISDSSIHISHDDCLFGFTEDIHMIIGHLTCYYLREYFSKQF